jgi:hypothetical protein
MMLNFVDFLLAAQEGFQSDKRRLQNTESNLDEEQGGRATATVTIRLSENELRFFKMLADEKGFVCEDFATKTITDWLNDEALKKIDHDYPDGLECFIEWKIRSDNRVSNTTSALP